MPKHPYFLPMNTIDTDTRSTGDDQMAYTHANTYAYHRHAPVRVFSGLAARAIGLILTWQERARSRRELEQLDDRLLKDIGLNRIDALRESDKPFWKG